MSYSKQPSLTVVFPLDPLGPKIGGAEAFIRGVVEHCPEDIAVRFIGTSSDVKQRPLYQWTPQQLGKREFEYFGLMYEPNEDMRTKIPLSLRFVLNWMRHKPSLDSSVLLHNRVETLVLPGLSAHPSLAIIHNDVPAQIESGPSEVLWSRFPKVYRQIEKLFYSRAQRLYTVSMNTLNDASARYPKWADKFQMLPTWIDSNQYHPEPTTKTAVVRGLEDLPFGAPDDARWILYVGRLQPQKQPNRVLDTFAAYLSAHESSAHLIMVGDGNLRRETESHIKRLGIDSQVHLLGAIPKERIIPLYRAADCLLLASDFEGMPITVLEAQACGLPVVSTKTGELPRIIGSADVGRVLDSTSPQVLADALAEVVCQRNRNTPMACQKNVERFDVGPVLAPLYADIRAYAADMNTQVPS